MPIYEFYCKPCHTVYKFFSQTINTEKIPKCPECGFDKLQRRPSLFAAITGKGKDETNANGKGMPPIDESRMEKAMAMLAMEADKINEDDPKQAANLMRKLGEATGLKMGAGMEEALARLEKGEDPDQIEKELGDLLENEDPFVIGEKSKGSNRKPKARIDETLYDL
jgi:putative FmdB family regulatory protein